MKCCLRIYVVTYLVLSQISFAVITSPKWIHHRLYLIWHVCLHAFLCPQLGSPEESRLCAVDLPLHQWCVIVCITGLATWYQYFISLVWACTAWLLVCWLCLLNITWAISARGWILGLVTIVGGGHRVQPMPLFCPHPSILGLPFLGIDGRRSFCQIKASLDSS